MKAANDHGAEFRHPDDMAWETLRFPGQHSKMVFHPHPGRPTEPNAGLVRYEPGASHPRHRHDFAQIWYILEGDFTIGGRNYGRGTMVFHPDPHVEEELTTASGGVILYVQYQGPTTGEPPIYQDRFNVKARKPASEEQLDK